MAISLKKYSIEKIEETIAAALSNLCGETVSVSIASLADRKSFSLWKVAIEAEIAKAEIEDKTITF